MKKSVIISACMLLSLSILSGCTDDKDNSNSGTDLGNSVEIDNTEGKSDSEVSSGDNDIVFDFKDPENADGIEVVPRE